jgi:hypothetical protein
MRIGGIFMIKNLYLLSFILVLQTSGDACFARTTTGTYDKSVHKYFTGTVQERSSDGIVFNNQRYVFAPNIKIAAHEKISSGSFREVAARSSDIVTGANVIIKVVGTTIYELIIERWKQ